MSLCHLALRPSLAPLVLPVDLICLYFWMRVIYFWPVNKSDSCPLSWNFRYWGPGQSGESHFLQILKGLVPPIPKITLCPLSLVVSSQFWWSLVCWLISGKTGSCWIVKTLLASQMSSIIGVMGGEISRKGISTSGEIKPQLPLSLDARQYLATELVIWLNQPFQSRAQMSSLLSVWSCNHGE